MELGNKYKISSAIKDILFCDIFSGWEGFWSCRQLRPHLLYLSRRTRRVETRSLTLTLQIPCTSCAAHVVQERHYILELVSEMTTERRIEILMLSKFSCLNLHRLTDLEDLGAARSDFNWWPLRSLCFDDKIHICLYVVFKYIENVRNKPALWAFVLFLWGTGSQRDVCFRHSYNS